MAARLRVLGAAAGGGLPQWNCGCEGCRAARGPSPTLPPQSQSSIAVTADGARWLLVNASPDVRTQLAAFPPLGPPEGASRGSGVAAVALTNADVDHCAGLLVLREGGAPPIYGTDAVRGSLTDGLSILPALSAYGPVRWRPLVPGRATEIADADDAPIGVSATPFALAGKAPLYVRERVAEPPAGAHNVGLLLRAGDGPAVAYAPGVLDLADEVLREHLRAADVILIDGTFATDDELTARGMSARTARQMGHAPLLGAGGLLELLASLAPRRRVLVHLNNTNPVWGDREVRGRVEAEGVEVGFDGLEIEL